MLGGPLGLVQTAVRKTSDGAQPSVVQLMPECNLGNRERAEISRGNKRRRSTEQNLRPIPAHRAVVERRNRPAMMGIRMTMLLVVHGRGGAGRHDASVLLCWNLAIDFPDVDDDLAELVLQ